MYTVIAIISSVIFQLQGTTTNLDNKILKNKQLYWNTLLIFPGTKWCGASDIADDYDDLGLFARTDACCRDHDHRSDTIRFLQTKHGLTNFRVFSQGHCIYDENFYSCLKNVSTPDSEAVGDIYFNELSAQCFREDYPITGCKTFVSNPVYKCTEYIYNTTAPKKYQWFDVPPF